MFRRLVDRIATPPATDTPPRWLFFALVIMMAVFLVIDLLSWNRGGGVDFRRLITTVAMFLLSLFFYSRQRQIRLFSYFASMACFLLGLLRGLYHFMDGAR